MRRVRLGQDAYWTAAAIADDLRALGLRSGDAVMVHASLRSLGAVLGGADGVIAALRGIIGENGTLLAYTSWDEQHEDALDGEGRLPDAVKPHVPAFDPHSSRACRDHGWLAEAIRTTPGARRSGNPGASVAALGARADWFAADHPMDYGYGRKSPFDRLVQSGGSVLMLGAPLDAMSLLHHAEHRADIPGKHVRRFEAPIGGQWQMIEEFDTADPVVDGLKDDYFADIVREFLATGQGRQGQVGNASCVLVPAAAITRFAVEWLETRFNP